ncbi:MAG: hypothetical protein WEA80_10875 [Gemmatimonadaceae bacterium]
MKFQGIGRFVHLLLKGGVFHIFPRRVTLLMDGAFSPQKGRRHPATFLIVTFPPGADSVCNATIVLRSLFSPRAMTPHRVRDSLLHSGHLIAIGSQTPAS